MGVFAFFALLALLGALAAALYFFQPEQSVTGFVRDRRQRVLRRHPVYGHMGSFLGVLVPVFEIAVAPDGQGESQWMPCTRQAYHSVREGGAYRFLIRGAQIVRAEPVHTT